MTSTNDYIVDDIRDTLIDAGFQPGDDAETVPALWVSHWDAYRYESDSPFSDLLLVNFTDDEIRLTWSTHNGVTRGTARFDANPYGLILFRNAVGS